jgi:hypothetical protein
LLFNTVTVFILRKRAVSSSSSDTKNLIAGNRLRVCLGQHICSQEAGNPQPEEPAVNIVLLWIVSKPRACQKSPFLSETGTAFDGRTSVSSLHNLSGRMGTAWNFVLVPVHPSTL